MKDEVKHLHIKNPTVPYYSISFKGIINTLARQGGIVHMYAPRADIRLRSRLIQEDKAFIRKRVGREHWVYCLESDPAAKRCIEQMDPDEVTRFNPLQATGELIQNEYIKVPIERAASVSKAYYDSSYFKETLRNIILKPAEEKEFMEIILAQ